MSTFEWKGRHWKIVPFLIITATLLFFVFWFGSIAYSYHLDLNKNISEEDKKRLNSALHEENRKLKQEIERLKKNIFEEAKKLNSAVHEENIKLKQEIEHLKSTPYELRRDTGELKDHGFTSKELRDNRFTIEKLKEAGFTAKQLKAYFSVKELKDAGYTLKELIDVGWAPKMPY